MSPYSKKYAPEYAKVLIRVAEGDLNTARYLARPEHLKEGGRTETTLFLIQQSIEKALKAVICWCGREVPLIHDLRALASAIPDEPRPPAEKLLEVLSEYATVRRYEEGYEVVTSVEVSAAVSVAEAVLLWAKERIAGPSR